MKVLVLWTDGNPPTTSIVDKKDVKVTSKSTKARWGKAWLDVKIITENDDEKWLESLTVSTEGNIIKSCTVAPELLAKKRQSRKNKQENLKKKKEAIDQINEAAVKGRSIFSESEDDDEVLNEKSKDTVDLTEDAQLPSVAPQHPENPEPTASTSKNGSSAPNKELKHSRSTKLTSCYFCKITPEDASYEEKFMAIAESSLLHLQNLREQYGMCPISTSEVVLAPGLDVKINRYRLNDFLRFSKGDPKALTRYILKEIVNEKELSHMNASTIPKDIFNSVERYVNSHVSSNKKLSLSEFKRCITLYCAYLKAKETKSNVRDVNRGKKRNSTSRSDSEVSGNERSEERSRSSIILDTSSKNLSGNRSQSSSSNRSQSSEKSRSQERSTSRSRDRENRREKNRSKERSTSRNRDRENKREKIRSKERSTSRSRDRENRREKSRSKERSPSRSKNREKRGEKSRSKERSPNRSKNREKSTSKEKSRSRQKSIENSKEQTRNKNRSISPRREESPGFSCGSITVGRVSRFEHWQSLKENMDPKQFRDELIEKENRNLNQRNKSDNKSRTTSKEKRSGSRERKQEKRQSSSHSRIKNKSKSRSRSRSEKDRERSKSKKKHKKSKKKSKKRKRSRSSESRNDKKEKKR